MRGLTHVVAYTKRALLPFIKLVHPDIFARQRDEVKRANLACVQNMNELWDTLGGIEKQTLTGGSSVFIRTPLKPVYDLYCFAKFSSESETRSVAMTLRPPHELTKQHSISVADARRALATMMKPMISFFSKVGVSRDALPFSDREEAGVISSGKQRCADSSSRDGAMSPRQPSSPMDAIVFDRAVSTHHHLRRFRPNPTTFSSQTLLAQCEGFLRSGHVLVSGLVIEEEQAALDKLKCFLLNYGDVLNFSCTSWADVMVVLTKPLESKICAGQSRFGNGRYECKAYEGRPLRILSVPHDFREKEFLAFLCRAMPNTNPFA